MYEWAVPAEYAVSFLVFFEVHTQAHGTTTGGYRLHGTLFKSTANVDLSLTVEGFGSPREAQLECEKRVAAAHRILARQLVWATDQHRWEPRAVILSRPDGTRIEILRRANHSIGSHVSDSLFHALAYEKQNWPFTAAVPQATVPKPDPVKE